MRVFGKGILAWGVLAILTTTAPCFAGPLNYTAHTIDGEQEVPPNPSPAVGTGTFVVDPDANTVSYHITFPEGALLGEETAAAIHGFAGRGAIGPVLHALPLGSPKVGVWNYDESQEDSLIWNLAYVNIRTTVFPEGEIRGQVDPFFDLTLTPEDVRFTIVGDSVLVEIDETVYAGWNDDDRNTWSITIRDCEGNLLSDLMADETAWLHQDKCEMFWGGQQYHCRNKQGETCPNMDTWTNHGCRKTVENNVEVCKCKYTRNKQSTQGLDICYETCVVVTLDALNASVEWSEENNSVTVVPQCEIAVEPSSWGRLKTLFR